jgi:hypothetical protein
MPREEEAFMTITLAEVLEKSGIPINFQAGGTAPERVVGREVQKQPSARAKLVCLALDHQRALAALGVTL